MRGATVTRLYGTISQDMARANSRARPGVASRRAARRVSGKEPPMLHAQTIEHDPRWAQVRLRDASADGSFVYSVKTTGVYCRPSCAARPARPENVDFHPSPKDAERAGFRACKRCKPNEPPLAARQAAQIAALCR